ncbi:MAG TPA: hypothetical protein VHT97_00430 [Acidimicrobiales bacterium]|jgi:hypothetical protein|nr:hypothetical protein [Acidimicrobiales bacterium]
MSTDDDLGRAVGELAAGGPDRPALTRLVGLARSSMKEAGSRSVATGRWLADVVVDTAPHLPVRDVATLSAHHGGLTGPELAGELIRAASRTTAAMGALAGAVAGAEELSPPTWLAIPGELVVETLAVVAVELKLVAELQEVYGQPVTGTATERSVAVVRAWAEGRGVTARTLTEPGGLASAFGRTTRRELSKLLQRRLARRMLRSTSALAPFLTGAVAGAELNRRATRSLGESVVRDLASRR